MEFKDLQKLIQKYQNGTATPAERFIVDVWYQSLDEEEAESPDAITPEFVSQTEQRILAQTVLATKKPIIKRLSRSWAAAAALLPLLALSYYLWFKPDPITTAFDKVQRQIAKTYQTGPMEQKTILLADSTIVQLNANTKLQVLDGYKQEIRGVILTGEAFFDVKKDPHHPFVIRGGELDVRVLGTSFNVQAYPGLKNTNVMVHSGKVQVSSKDKMLSELSPNKELRFDRNAGTYRLMDNATPVSDSWMSGVVILDRATFQELSQTFYNMYGRQLITKDKGLLKDRYNITFRKSIQLNDMLEQILRLTEKNYTKKREDSIQIVLY